MYLIALSYFFDVKYWLGFEHFTKNLIKAICFDFLAQKQRRLTIKFWNIFTIQIWIVYQKMSLMRLVKRKLLIKPRHFLPQTGMWSKSGQVMKRKFFRPEYSCFSAFYFDKTNFNTKNNTWAENEFPSCNAMV